MKRRLVVLLIISLVLQGCATIGKPWEAAEDRKTGRRFIPIELWSGQAWDGELAVKTNPARLRFGSRGHKHINGPISWRHPVTGKTLQVYERTNETTKGTKLQYFTPNPEGTGLAKVYDQRPGRQTRTFSENAVLFPIGWWKKGERRTYEFEEFVDGKRVKRIATLRIRRLSFTYKDNKHAIKYDWLLTDAKGKLLFHERFIYAPGKSLMYFKNRMKR